MPRSGLLLIAAAAAAIGSGAPASAGVFFKIITVFPLKDGNGGLPAEVIVDPADGRSLIGMTPTRGTSYPGSGTLFELTPPPDRGLWDKRNLYVFPGTEGGVGPSPPLLPDGAGGVFGLTGLGNVDHGTIFQATPGADPNAKWNAVALYRFRGDADGSSPSGLVRGGNLLFGTTVDAGPACPTTHDVSCGTVFRLSSPKHGGTAWHKRLIYSFTGRADGGAPEGRLLFENKQITGTAFRGGGGPCVFGCGVVYQLTMPASDEGPWTQQVLYTFAGGSHGAGPLGGLAPDGAGNYFGATLSGGKSDQNGDSFGTIYKLTKVGAVWTHSVLYRFTGGADGSRPNRIYFDRSRNAIFGTTSSGGSTNDGTVYRLDLSENGSWTLTTLHTFDRTKDCALPVSGLVREGLNRFYGTTYYGRHGGCVFQITLTP